MWNGFWKILFLIIILSYEEAARYLETYKAYENKPPDLLMERIDSDFSSRVNQLFSLLGSLSSAFLYVAGCRMLDHSEED